MDAAIIGYTFNTKRSWDRIICTLIFGDNQLSNEQYCTIVLSRCAPML